MSIKQNILNTLRAVSVAAVGSALLIGVQAAAEDDCAPVVKALQLQEATPHRILVEGREPMIFINGTMYAHTKRGWMKLPMNVAAMQAAEKDKAYTQCRMSGKESVNGIPTLAYQYSRQFKGATGNSRIWIGADGLVYKFETTQGQVQTFDYKDVQAPTP